MCSNCSLVIHRSSCQAVQDVTGAAEQHARRCAGVPADRDAQRAPGRESVEAITDVGDFGTGAVIEQQLVACFDLPGWNRLGVGGRAGDPAAAVDPDGFAWPLWCVMI
jgi:hypothetical protein